MKTNILKIAIICTVIIVLSVGAIYGKNIMSVFFDSEDAIEEIDNSDLLDSGDTVKIDDYTISLEKTSSNSL